MVLDETRNEPIGFLKGLQLKVHDEGNEVT